MRRDYEAMFSESSIRENKRSIMLLAMIQLQKTLTDFRNEKAQAYEALAEWTISELSREKQKRFLDQLEVQKQTFSANHPLMEDSRRQLEAIERMWAKIESD